MICTYLLLLSVQTKKMKKHYTAFSEFVRDVALICHNAQVYNRPSSSFFKDAGQIRELFKAELQKLAKQGTISAQDADLPDLGEIPEVDDEELDEEEEEEQEDDDDDEVDDEVDDEEDDEDDADDSDFDARRSRKGVSKDEGDRTKRTRPPKMLNPLEARLHSMLRNLNEVKWDGERLTEIFDILPDREEHPDYYETIKMPIAIADIKSRAKRNNYMSLDQVAADFDLMFNNAKEYNEDDSLIFKAAVELQRRHRPLLEREKARPENDFRDEEGRLPMYSITNRGERWRTGDWVCITNPNDVTKPTVAQIFRTWLDAQNLGWVNVCWYYRPDQTVHRSTKTWYDNEVVKTSQFRNHRVDELVDRCFVMSVQRYPVGRPRGLPKDKAVYVCRWRYNEDKHRFSSIKNWTICLPDEIRDKDYEMEMFDVPIMMRKVNSPIKHLLREDAKPSDPLPKPTWGAANAPPLIGAVHSREREANVSF